MWHIKKKGARSLEGKTKKHEKNTLVAPRTKDTLNAIIKNNFTAK